MLTAYETISYGNEYCRSFSGFLPCGRGAGRSGVSRGTRVSRSLRGGQRSLPPVYSLKVLPIS